MRKSFLLSALLAVCTAMPLAAQSTVRSFPKPLDQKTIAASQAQKPARVPSKIDDASQGLPMYIGEITAYDRKRGFCKFYTGHVWDSFTRLQIYNEAYADYQVYGMRCGTWTGDKYFAYITNIYGGSGISWELPAEFVEIDPATGVKTIIHEFDSSEQEGWPTMYDMMFDRTYDTLYALGQGTDDNGYGVTELYMVSTTDGSYQKVFTFDCIYYNMAFDYDGNLYGVRPTYGTNSDGSEYISGSELVKLDEDFAEVSTVECTNWGSSFTMGSMTTMAFDFTTGDLWWLPLDSYYSQRVFKLNTETGVMDDNYGSYYGGYQFAGLYIPYLTADKRTAAAQVSELDAQADVNGAMADTLKWTNPSTTWNKQELSELSEVLVYRKKVDGTSNELSSTAEILSEDNAELVATVSGAEVGQTMQWVDTDPHNGINTYYVVPCRVSGEKGVPDSVRCYMGVDVPDQVTNIQVTTSGEYLQVSWTAPEHGVNNGYINPDELTYKLIRMPDNIVVADGITETTLLDKEPLGEVQNYYYYIYPSNKAGEGVMAQSDYIYAGAPIEPPVDLGFTSWDEANRWTSIDANSDYSYFYYTTYAHYDDAYHSVMVLNTYGAADDWLITPALRLKGGHSYRFSADFINYYNDSPFNISTAVGKSNTAEAMTPLLRNDEGLTSDSYNTKWNFEDYFTPDEDGTYFYGFHVGGSSQDNYYFTGLSISEVFENDLSAVSIDNVTEAVAGAENSCTVKVRNTGKNEQSAYKVKIVCNGSEVVGETTDVPAIKMGLSADVPVTFTPTEDGYCDFVAVVELAGDECADNDSSAVLTLNVQPAGTAPFTNIVTGANETIDTNVPCSWSKSSETSQTLYLASEIEAPETGSIVRMGYEYDSNSNLTDRLDESDFSIYMANTDKASYAVERDDYWNTWSYDWVNFSDFTLVYSGKITVEPGHNIVSFNLDTPFEYDRSKNLAVFVMRDGAVDDYSMWWPVLWRVYNDYQYDSNYNVLNDYRTLRTKTAYSDGAEGIPEVYVPVLYLAFSKSDGITRVGGSENAEVSYDNGNLVFGKNITRAQVYDVSGKLLHDYNVAAGQSTAAPVLSQGVYVVRTQTTDGTTQSVKLSIAK